MNRLIAGTDGRKMSSSWSNVVSLLDSPEEMFGKTMSIPDPLIGDYLNFLPFSVQPFSASDLRKKLVDGNNPRDLKLQVAVAITELYHGSEAALTAADAFRTQFSDRTPTEDVTVPEGNLPLMEVIVRFTSWTESRSELRRVFMAGGVELDGRKVTDPQELVQTLPATLKVGKRILVRLVG